MSKRPKGPASFRKGEKPPILRGRTIEVGGKTLRVRSPVSTDVLNVSSAARRRLINKGFGLQ